MAHTRKGRFGDLQMDERYKKLERSLKLALLRKGNKTNSTQSETSIAPTWASVSSINADIYDSNCTVPSLQTSRIESEVASPRIESEVASPRIESEVVSSSNNLRNILLKKKATRTNNQIMTTSSIKRYHLGNDDHHDRLIMPPPAIDVVPRSSKTEPKGIYSLSNVPQGMLTSHNMHTTMSTQTDGIMAIQNVSPRQNTDAEYQNIIAGVQSAPTESRRREPKIFSQWRVILNSDRQLIIKGTLECGIVARSKPIIKRLTAVCVESLFKHIYYLQGAITDNRHKLPDYVRGKFYNGFPDDWENVYQIWRSYVDNGCPLTFRWPTPVADSDDDLNSEITDLTFSCSKRNKARSFKLGSFRESHDAKITISSGYVSNTLQGRGDKSNNDDYSNNATIGMNDSPTQTCISPSTENISYEYVNSETVDNKENRKQESCNVSHVFVPKEINKLHGILQEDMLHTVIKNLADKNCSQEYIDKFFEFLDRFNYVFSYRSNTEIQKEELQPSTIQESSKSNLQKEDSGVMHDQESTYTSDPIALSDSAVVNKVTYEDACAMEQIQCEDRLHRDSKNYSNVQLEDTYSNCSIRGNKHTEMEKFDLQNQDDSESEIYTGIPKISLERVLQRNAAVAKPYKRKTKKNVPFESRKFNIPEAENHSNATVNRSCRQTSLEQNNVVFNDSSISITEDEIEYVKKTNTKQHMPVHVREGNLNKNSNTFSNSGSLAELDNIGCKESFDFGNVHQGNKIKPNIKTDKSIGMTKAIPNRSLLINTETENGNSEQSNTQQKYPNDSTCWSKDKLTNDHARPVTVNTQESNITMTFMGAESKQQAHNLNLELSKNQKRDYVQKGSLAQFGDMKCATNTSSIRSKNHLISNTAKPTTEHAEHSKTSKVSGNLTLLTSWVPKVVCRSSTNAELGLVFEGKLLNDAGHVTHKKFVTGFVSQRVSARIFETEDHEYYQLVGDLSDTKRVVPKELLQYVRNGCPTKVEQFCRMWRSLRKDISIRQVKIPDTTIITTLTLPISSRGRTIVPPLNYWNGERIALRDDTPMYSPGSLEDSFMSAYIDKKKTSTEKSSTEKLSTKAIPKREQSTHKEPSNILRDTSAFEENLQIKNQIKSNKSFDKEEIINTRKSAKDEYKQLKRVAQNLQFLSDSSNEENAPLQKRQKTIRMRQISNGHRKVQSKKPSLDVDATEKITKSIRSKARTESPSKNKTIAAGSVKTKYDTPCQSTARGHGRDITCTYYQNIPLRDEVLSDDQLSHA